MYRFPKSGVRKKIFWLEIFNYFFLDGQTSCFSFFESDKNSSSGDWIFQVFFWQKKIHSQKCNSILKQTFKAFDQKHSKQKLANLHSRQVLTVKVEFRSLDLKHIKDSTGPKNIGKLSWYDIAIYLSYR